MAKKLIKPKMTEEAILLLNHFRDGGEYIEDERITVDTGYVPPRYRIERMFEAGQTLTGLLRGEYEFKNKKGVYDFDGIPVDHELRDPTRQRGFDMADATQLAYARQEEILRSYDDDTRQRQSEESLRQADADGNSRQSNSDTPPSDN